ncbi:hypothetical protein FJY69_11190 [candidate division WOR-3 bacterium]|nr:hypothetical protein [candidate division WOR-3 bacterium]
MKRYLKRCLRQLLMRLVMLFLEQLPKLLSEQAFERLWGLFSVRLFQLCAELCACLVPRGLAA